MIAKKNPKVDLEGKRAAIFNVGLLVAGSFTLAAFTYTETTTTEAEKMAVVVEEIVTFEVEEKEEVKPDIVKPDQAETPDQPQDEPQNLGSQTGLAQDIKSSKNTTDGLKKPDGSGLHGFEAPFKPTVFDTDDEIVIPEIDASYVGGLLEMKKKIFAVQEYPEIDIELGNQGIVYVSFVVEKDGSVTNIKAVRGVSQTLDREAVRIVKSFPKWIPGEDKYGAVRTRVRMPIKFLLE
ncbi:MAG: energy transducer TonB [Crocinitomicaceae bacterium]|nr:energy transducer TonB [Flavobacteriales bacterium]NQZ37675.1 energy transducer TonB [Crocinitomicaceae bacterium]